jgi:probable phosphoglycerate mutase
MATSGAEAAELARSGADFSHGEGKTRSSLESANLASPMATSPSGALPLVYLARHGETAWTISRQHTGLTDLPLTTRGELDAVRLGERLAGLVFAAVFTSPLQRASRTCELAGFGSEAKVEPDLVEWDYGAYEGRTSAEIHAERADWELFRDGCPDGESPDQVGARADRVIRRVRAIGDDVLLFSSGHFLRVFAARWLGLEPGAGRYFLLGTVGLSAVGYEHDRSEPVIRLWNELPPERRVP